MGRIRGEASQQADPETSDCRCSHRRICPAPSRFADPKRRRFSKTLPRTCHRRTISIPHGSPITRSAVPVSQSIFKTYRLFITLHRLTSAATPSNPPGGSSSSKTLFSASGCPSRAALVPNRQRRNRPGGAGYSRGRRGFVFSVTFVSFCKHAPLMAFLFQFLVATRSRAPGVAAGIKERLRHRCRSPIGHNSPEAICVGCYSNILKNVRAFSNGTAALLELSLLKLGSKRRLEDEE